MRRDILEAVIRTVADEGRTVFFSSHLLEEIERVSDQIAMLHKGRVVFSGSLDDVKSQHRCLTLRFETAQQKPPSIPGVLRMTGSGAEWTILSNGTRIDPLAINENHGARIVDEYAPTLNEIFVAHATSTTGTLFVNQCRRHSPR